MCMNYIKLAEGVDADLFQEKIRYLPHQYIGKELEEQGVEFSLIMQPIRDIHLYSHLNWEAEASGNPLYVRIFIGVGLLILLITCMNFINLTTARSANRAGEVGMRKVVGAQRRQLIGQFLGESVLLAAIAMVFSCFFVMLLLPAFNNLLGAKFSWAHMLNPAIVLSLCGIMLFLGVIGGSYPAFFLSAFKPSAVLRGSLRAGTKGVLMRKILVVGQFAISITLIIGTILFEQQLNYMKNTDLGFDKEQKLVIEFDRSIITPSTYESVKTEMLKHPSITGATFSSSVPGRWMYLWQMWPYGERDTNSQLINCFQVDYDFLHEYDIELVAGRYFQKEMGTDQPGVGNILNEAAVRTFGWNSVEEVLGKDITDENSPVIGVVKDFHFRGLQNKVEPLLMFVMVEDFRYISLTVNTENLSETLAFIDQKYQELYPNTIYEYFFLDKDFDMQYWAEEQIGKIFSIFTFFGIFIACLGLLGLASFVAEQRTKEIGIRKVLGASVSGIVVMLSREFVKWVLLANIIAWPLAWLGMNYWLRDFAYRIDITITPFIVSGLLALIIAFVTVSVQTFKAGRANPVQSLNYE